MLLRAAMLGLLMAGVIFQSATAGIYSGPTDTTNSIDAGIVANDARFVLWANAIDPTRTTFAARGSTAIDSSGGFNSLGDLTTSEIAGGAMPGHLTVTFSQAIGNGNGADFAVFENGGTFFPSPFLYAELAFVEVSTNGSDFARFRSIATNTESDLITSFGRSFAGVDTTNIYNLAGKHATGLGTPFDLDDLSADPLVTNGVVDLNDIQYVRMVDIPGDGSFLDSLGNPILDAWLTEGSGGFDFRLGEGAGVGAINLATVPEPGTLTGLLLAAATFLGWRQRRTGGVRT